MKRFSALVLVAVVVACLSGGCGGGEKIYTDSSKTIVTRVGQEFTIALDSNPTTGYTWQETHDVVFLSLQEDRYEPDEKAEGLVGAGGTQYYRYKAVRKGQVELRLFYLRPWEEETIEETVFRVVIK
jgi:inhibitor of cysteine peptidase